MTPSQRQHNCDKQKSRARPMQTINKTIINPRKNYIDKTTTRWKSDVMVIQHGFCHSCHIFTLFTLATYSQLRSTSARIGLYLTPNTFFCILPWKNHSIFFFFSTFIMLSGDWLFASEKASLQSSKENAASTSSTQSLAFIDDLSNLECKYC